MKQIDKKEIVSQLRTRVEDELAKVKEAYASSHNLATSSELKSEGKYDTRSIEAGYIAGAQKKRVDELELELGLLDEINTEHTPESISVGSLVTIEFNKMERLYFISSTGGGSMLNFSGETVLVISAFSPIGSEAIGLESGDEFEVENANGTRLYKIKRIQ